MYHNKGKKESELLTVLNNITNNMSNILVISLSKTRFIILFIFNKKNHDNMEFNPKIKIEFIIK